MPYDTHQVYGSWLDAYRWDTFATLTFRTEDYGQGPVPPTLKKCRAATERTLKHVGFQRAFWAAERGFEGRWHVHALLASPEGEDVPMVSARPTRRTLTPTAKDLDSWWREKYGLTRIERYLPARGAAHYVSKYVSKTLADYDWWQR